MAGRSPSTKQLAAPRRRSVATTFAVAAAAVAATFAISYALPAEMTRAVPLMLFAPAAMVSAWYGGLWPGLVAMIAGMLLGDWFYLPPTHSLFIVAPPGLLLLIVYVGVTFCAVGLLEALHRSRRRSEREAALRRTAEDQLAQEIGQRKEAEQRRLVQLAVTHVLAESTSLTEAAGQILRAICQTADWKLGAIWQLDPAANLLRCIEVWSSGSEQFAQFKEGSRHMTFAKGIGLPGRVWSTGNPAWIGDVTKDDNFPRAPLASREGLRAAFGFPIKLGDEFLGVIEFFSPEIRQPDEPFLQMMTSIGGQVGHFIQRERARQQMRDVDERLNMILNSMTDRFIALDSHWRFTYLNKQAEEQVAALGKDPAAIMGKVLWEVFPNPPVEEPFRQAMYKRQPLVHEHYHPALCEWVENRIYPTSDGGIAVFQRYITDRKRMEQALEQSREAAQAASRAKDQFLAVLSHELRTPLTPVLMTISALEGDQQLRQQVRDDLAMVHRNIDLEVKLIDDLLDVTRIARGKLHLNRQPLNLHPLVRSALHICQAELKARNIELRCELEAGHDHISADPSRLHQVLWNIIRNAIKFTPEGGTVSIRTSNPPGQPGLIIEIADTGVGIEPADLGRIFNAFDQGGQSTSRRFGGLGLGLAISKALVEMHGGSIAAHSEGKGKGARFTIRIPTTLQPAPRRLPPPTPSDVPAGGLRLLLVEDHHDTAGILKRLLEHTGHSVTTAGSAGEALTLAGSFPFDLLISDIGLPDATGHELMQRLRDQYGMPGIAMSGFGQGSDVARSRDAGFVAHLVKPVDFNQLEAAIRQCATKFEIRSTKSETNPKSQKEMSQTGNEV
jgi:signal transduction histidine kinase/ActR/RegA family two-component response regulator